MDTLKTAVNSDPDSTDEHPSKSQRKRDMDALQDLGAQLVTLSADRLKKIILPDRLRDAVNDARRFTSHGARRRQLQYIGKLMRDIDPAPIQAALDEINGTSAVATARFHALERLRQRVLEDAGTIGELRDRHPGLDVQHLLQLRRNALKEQEQGKPPRAFRELFQILRMLEEGSAVADRATTSGGTDDHDA